MKNLSVGKKLGVGYGIIIVLLVVILVMTLVTSLQREESLLNIAHITDLQTEANMLRGTVNEARVELRTVFNERDYTTEYDNAVSYLEQALVGVDSMDQLVMLLHAEERAAYSEANNTLRNILSELLPTLAAIRSNDINLNQSIATMDTAATGMMESGFALVQTIRQFLGGEADALITQLQNVTLPAADIYQKISTFSLNGETFSQSMNLELVPGLIAMADEIELDIARLQNAVATAEGRAAVTAVAEDVEAYRQAVQQAVAYLEDSGELAQRARSELATLIEVVNGGVTAINDTVNASVDGLTKVSNTVMILMTAVSILASLIAVAVAIVLTRAFTRPLKKMQTIMRQAGEEGNLKFSEEVRQDVLKETLAKDEISQSLLLFAKLIDRFVYLSECLETVAGKDLRLQVALLGPDDTMGNALTTMLNNLNETFTDISSVGLQVATSSGEIAQGAQSLAQGSTEQASTVQEISASINEITEQSKSSNQMAGEAARFSGDIRKTAEDGTVKMDEMIRSVRQINDASQDIGDVIKVIDDIAFQTNILALNAAVEAARAGEHGKGFAVVADEVRNLAGKSADAAKKTAELISANIEKAGTGMQIAQDTAESLRQIVEGIQKTSGSLDEIAEQSASNERATEQVNLAIDQVAQVVQQNSATSEESAAASEEMSSQAQVLQNLILQFKLRGQHGGGMAALPSAPVAEPVDEYTSTPKLTTAAAVIF